MNLPLCILLSYFVGSLPTGYVVGRLVRRIDVRKHGSGNVGATNVFRVVGKKWGVVVLLIDVLKGFLPSFLIPRHMLSQSPESSFTASLIIGLAAIAGHTWTIWLRFRGGKGVATSLGVLLAVVPQAAAFSLGVWVLLLIWRRYVSLASVGMALSFPLWVILFYRDREFFVLLTGISFGLAFFILFTHRANLQRLRQGTENRIF